MTSTSAPAITDAQMVTVVVMRALTGLTGKGGGRDFALHLQVPARRVSPCSRLVRMQWVAVSTGRPCGLARGRAGRDHHAYWLSCPVDALGRGEKFVVHKSRKGNDCWLSCERSVRFGGRDSIATGQFSL